MWYREWLLEALQAEPGSITRLGWISGSRVKLMPLPAAVGKCKDSSLPFKNAPACVRLDWDLLPLGVLPQPPPPKKRQWLLKISDQIAPILFLTTAQNHDLLRVRAHFLRRVLGQGRL